MWICLCVADLSGKFSFYVFFSSIKMRTSLKKRLYFLFYDPLVSVSPEFYFFLINFALILFFLLRFCFFKHKGEIKFFKIIKLIVFTKLFVYKIDSDDERRWHDDFNVFTEKRNLICESANLYQQFRGYERACVCVYNKEI